MARIRRYSAPKSFGLSFALHSMSLMAFAALGFFAMTGNVHSPSIGFVADAVAPELTAQLSFSNNDPMITGSVSALFNQAVFVGPNRLGKTDRARTQTDVALYSKGFNSTREQLIEIRLAAAKRLPFIDAPDNETALSLASASPDAFFAALKAIERAARPVKPEPLVAPTSLAYARANAPATIFETPVSMRVSAKQSNCLATAIYFEARGESYRGQVAVAQVVMNRVNHGAYPSTICSVVFQNHTKRNACQFSFACDGIPERVTEKKLWAQAEEIAKKVTSGDVYLTAVGNATHYHANYVHPRWAPKLKRMTKIGLHIFYRFRSS